ncbi:MAG: hypothetical protein ISS33_01000 [Candidatus Omnitrophica bacterium]|nr:hypothetical protein [Candidatus Omnitrophota bacterium]
MEKLNKEIVVQTWFFRGLEDIFFAFQIESPFRYEPFFHTMGFEMICKSYLLAKESAKYENMERDQAIQKINTLAIQWGHNIKKMVDEIKNDINNPVFSAALSASYDSFTGDQFIKVMEAAYLECRYPVPKHIHEEFPIDGQTDLHWEPLASSGLEKFCFAFMKKIIIYLKKRFNIPIPKKEFDKIITDEAGVRFCNLFLKDIPNDFLENEPITSHFT